MFSDIRELNEYLSRTGINTEAWGTGTAKTIEMLWTEIESGETVLVESPEGLTRQLTVCVADVHYMDDCGNKFFLIEAIQVFNDGRVRRREFGHSVSEKRKTNENEKKAIERGLREELGLEGKIAMSQPVITRRSKNSASYPNLPTQYVYHIFRVDLRTEQYQEDGYIERAPDLTSYFVWIPVFD